jgi:hypothetical protein
MRVIMLDVDKPAVVKDIDSSLEGMQKIVGGLIELYCPFEDETVGIIINEEGKILGLDSNRIVSNKSGEPLDLLCGPAFIVNLDPDEGLFTDLTDEQIERLMPRLKLYNIQC